MKFLPFLFVVISIHCSAQIDVDSVQRKHNSVMDTVTHIVGEGGCYITGFDSLDIISTDIFRDFMISEKGIMLASKRELVILTKEKAIYLDLNKRTPEVSKNTFGLGQFWEGLHLKNLEEADTMYRKFEYYGFEFHEYEDDELVSSYIYQMDTSTFVIDRIEIRQKDEPTQILYIQFPWLNAEVEPDPIEKPYEFIKSLPPVFH